VAFSISPEERLAWTIIIGRFEGQDFDFNAGRWKERK
jgi:hypothetical protein